MKNTKKKNWCQRYLTNHNLFLFLEKCDSDLAEKCRQGGCLLCSGKLHRADYRRKPRGGPQLEPNQEVYRDSFCCDQDGCRKRHTPASLRFLGRKVYWGMVVILVSAMRHGLKVERLEILRESLGIDRRTLQHWREWWLENFVQSSFWKAARARFIPVICEKTLPWSLCQAFGIARRNKLLKLLRFLRPITTHWVPLPGGS